MPDLFQPDVRPANVGVEFAGDFELIDVSIRSFTGNTKSLRMVLVELNIYESLFSPTMTGTLVIRDALNLPVYIPIVGNETISIRFRTPTMGEIDKTFSVYHVSARTLTDKEREQGYIVHFCSPEQVENNKTKISRAFTNVLPESIVEQVLRRDIASTKNLIIEPSRNETSIVVPNWTPFRLCNFLANRAISQEFPNDASFFFFERQDGFVFSSLASMFAANDAQEYIFQPANIRKSGSDASRTVDTDLRAISDYSVQSTFNVLDNLERGMYGNHLVTFDFTTKTWVQHEWSYVDTWPNYRHMETATKQIGQNDSLLCSKTNNDYGHAYNAALRFFPAGHRAEEWMQHRISLMQQLQNIRLTITVPGDSRRKVGEMVTVKLPSPEPITNELVYDKYLTGRYLITAVRHQIALDKYTLHLELAKDSFAVPLPKEGQNGVQVVDVFGRLFGQLQSLFGGLFK